MKERGGVKQGSGTIAEGEGLQPETVFGHLQDRKHTYTMR